MKEHRFNAICLCLPSTHGRNEGEKGGTIPRASNHYEGAEKSKQSHRYFLHSKFASKKWQLEPEGANLFVATAPSNLVTPLLPPIGWWVK